MGDFDRALAVVLRFEGGYSNDPADHGGTTNRGVTQATYDEYRHLLELPCRPVAEIEPGEVEGVYRRLFWEPCGAEHLDWPMSLFVFDAAVNQGSARARTMLLAAQLADVSPAMELYALAAIRRYLYLRTAMTDPTQRKFLAGWERRVDDLWKMVET